MDEGNSGSPGSCQPLSPLILPRVPNAGHPSWLVPLGPLNPLGSPMGAPPLRGDCRGGEARVAGASSPFLDLQGWDKMIPERLVLGPLSFRFSLGGSSSLGPVN